jgi:hypothetical protein
MAKIAVMLSMQSRCSVQCVGLHEHVLLNHDVAWGSFSDRGSALRARDGPETPRDSGPDQLQEAPGKNGQAEVSQTTT